LIAGIGAAAMTASIVERWPEAPTYGGVYDAVIPHLTVAQGIDEGTLALIEDDLVGGLPVRTDVREALLLAFDGGRWKTHSRLSFGS
jgi:hypothetical protein